MHCSQAPLTQPCVESISVVVFANEAAVSAFSYNFVNYKNQLGLASHFFTADGWKNYKTALDKSNNLTTVINKKLVASGVAQGAPIILQQGVVNGVYTWKIQFPFLATYQSSKESASQNLVINMTIVRSDQSQGMRGLAVTSLEAA